MSCIDMWQGKVTDKFAIFEAAAEAAEVAFV